MAGKALTVEIRQSGIYKICKFCGYCNLKSSWNKRKISHYRSAGGVNLVLWLMNTVKQFFLAETFYGATCSKKKECQRKVN